MATPAASAWHRRRALNAESASRASMALSSSSQVFSLPPITPFSVRGPATATGAKQEPQPFQTPSLSHHHHHQQHQLQAQQAQQQQGHQQQQHEQNPSLSHHHYSLQTPSVHANGYHRVANTPASAMVGANNNIDPPSSSSLMFRSTPVAGGVGPPSTLVLPPSSSPHHPSTAHPQSSPSTDAANRWLLSSLLQPLASMSRSCATQVVIAVTTTILFFHLLRVMVMSMVATPLILSCPTTDIPGSLSPLTRMATLAVVPVLMLSHYASYSLLERFLHVYPPSRRMFLALSLFVTPIHALLSAYVLYGPTLSPHQFFCTMPTSLVPASNALHTPVITALIYTPFFHVTLFHLRIYSAPPSAFPQSTARRLLLSIIPQALLTVIIPAIPTALSALGIALSTRPPRASLYMSIMLTMSRTVAALCAVMATVLPHSLLRLTTWDGGLFDDTTTGVPGHHSMSSTATTRSDHEEAIARDVMMSAGAGTSGGTASPQLIRRAVLTLCRAPQSRMLPFPPFGDPSGRQWRGALEATLWPLGLVATHVHGIRHPTNHNLRAQQPPIVVNAPLAVPDAVVQEAVAVARILPVLFEASVQHDSFGVALPTLPIVLSMLVLLHQGLCTAISADGETSASGTAPSRSSLSSLFPILRVFSMHPSLGKWIATVDDMIEKRSQLAALRTLKDVVSVSVYRLSFVFQEEVRRFVDGREPGWDDQATDALRPFIQFQV